MHAKCRLPVLSAAVVLLGSCGGDGGAGGDTTATVAEPTATAAAVVTTASMEEGSTTTTGVVVLEQAAIWPAAAVVFESAETAAVNFVAEVLGLPPELGEFQRGDARSGEIEVLSLGEGGVGTPVTRGRLLLRQLGPDDGWFILAAVNDNASITAPEAMAEVAAGPLTVEGQARGFEGNVVVTAFIAGDAHRVLDEVIVQGGAFETAEPFTADLDLTGASPRDVVTLLVRGGAGLETDPGDFGAIPVVITA